MTEIKKLTLLLKMKERIESDECRALCIALRSASFETGIDVRFLWEVGITKPRFTDFKAFFSPNTIIGFWFPLNEKGKQKRLKLINLAITERLSLITADELKQFMIKLNEERITNEVHKRNI